LVGREILPHERELRSWLRCRVASNADVEDIVQECYFRIAQLSDVNDVVQPRQRGPAAGQVHAGRIPDERARSGAPRPNFGIRFDHE
jgi:hypothetical protein